MTPRIRYRAHCDELMLWLRDIRGVRPRTAGRFTVWILASGEIAALAIRPYEAEQREFAAIMASVNLGGMWRGMKFTEEDIDSVKLVEKGKARVR